LHLGNVLLTLPTSFHDTSDEQLHAHYGAPETESVIRLDGDLISPGVPSYGIYPLWLGEPSEEITLSSANIWLMDFGEAFSPSVETRYDTFTPISVRPPELLFHSRGNPVSFSSDVWSLGCAFWKILGQRPLFEAPYEDRDIIICEQVDAMGSSVPSQWWSEWKARS
jgi:serine/threonine-protein kinase SRPK3